MLYARFIPAGNGTSQSSTFNDSKKARLQLARARRDLRELWLERDELAVMASEAMQVTYGDHTVTVCMPFSNSSSVPLLCFGLHRPLLTSYIYIYIY